MNRRSFFTRLAKAAVIAVSAPMVLREVIRAELPTVDPYWIETTCVGRYTDEAYDKFIADYSKEWAASGRSFLMMDIRDMAEEFQRRNP